MLATTTTVQLLRHVAGEPLDATALPHDDAERHVEHHPCELTVRTQRRRNSRVSDFLVGCDGAGGAPGTSKLSWSS